MNFSDETLMAYADGELGEPERSQVARAEREDPEVAAIIARHRRLRADVHAAFAGVLEEPVPARLQAAGSQDAARSTAAATVTSLAAARERKAKAREAAAAAKAASAQKPAWPRWGALAASLVVGVLAGSIWLGGAGDGGGDSGGGLVALESGGRLVAQGELANALSSQLASTAGQKSQDTRVRIGVSFAARGGGYCRSFQAGGSAGLACRDGDAWRIPVLREVPGDAAAYRQAGSTAPAAVLEVIDERIEGYTLDAAAERAARDRGWKR